MPKSAQIFLYPAEYPLSIGLFEALSGWKPAGSRVRMTTISAVCVLVTGEEATGRAAAKAAGITERTFYRFRSGKHGQQTFAKLTKMHRKGAGHKVILRMIELSQQANNLPVAMRASEWLANFAGYAPKSRVQSRVSVAPNSGGAGVVLPGSVKSDWLDQLITPSKGKLPPR